MTKFTDSTSLLHLTTCCSYHGQLSSLAPEYY